MNEYELYLSGLSIPKVSEKTGIPLSTLRFRFKKSGILRSRGDGVRNAAQRGLLGSGFRGKKRKPFSKKWRENIRKARIAHGKKYAKGYSKKPNGYIEITRGKNKGRSEHVVIMESLLKRRLTRGECVHHIDGDRSNNDIKNLRLMTISSHASLHAKENQPQRKRNKKGQFK